MATMVPIPDETFHANVSDVYGDRTPAPAPMLPTDPIRATYRAAVAEVAGNAKAALPDSGGRVDSAVKLVLAGDVEMQFDGSARVASQSRGGVQYLTVNGTCTCKDVAHAPAGQCKHKIARGISVRAHQLASAMLEMQAAQDAQPQEDAQPAPVEQEASAPTADLQLLQPHVVMIHGKAFVQYSGLLALAHARGLRELSARFVSVTPELAVAQATAVFADGRTFCDGGDSTPANVASHIKPHFIRMSLTRAKARVLRSALAIDMVSVEELSD